MNVVLQNDGDVAIVHSEQWDDFIRVDRPETQTRMEFLAILAPGTEVPFEIERCTTEGNA